MTLKCGGHEKFRDELVDLYEKHVKNRRDQIAYSHKPRPVQYTPGTVAEFKRKNPLHRNGKVASIEPLGKLPPDLHTDDLLSKLVLVMVTILWTT